MSTDLPGLDHILSDDIRRARSFQEQFDDLLRTADAALQNDAESRLAALSSLVDRARKSAVSVESPGLAAELDQLQSENAELRLQLQSLRDEHGKTTQVDAALNQTIADLKQTIDSLQTSAQSARDQWQRETAQLQQDHQAALARAQSDLAKAVKQSASELAESRQKFEDLVARVKELKSTNEHLAKAEQEFKRQIADLKTQLKTAPSRPSKSALDAAKQEELRQELANLKVENDKLRRDRDIFRQRWKNSS
jgi:chromosome segregation ATPase